MSTLTKGLVKLGRILEALGPRPKYRKGHHKKNTGENTFQTSRPNPKELPARRCKWEQVKSSKGAPGPLNPRLMTLACPSVMLQTCEICAELAAGSSALTPRRQC